MGFFHGEQPHVASKWRFAETSRPELQTNAQLISNNFGTISSQLADADIFRSTVAFPTPAFPGSQKETILQTLLRTKLEPNIEEWVKEGENFTAQQRKQGLSDEDRNSLWQWAPGAANGAARKQTWGGDKTRAEQQSGQTIVTGLRRQLVEPPEDEGDEVLDDDEEEYEGSDGDEDEDEDAMDVDIQKPKVEQKQISEAPAAATSASQPLASIHSWMTKGVRIKKA